MQFAEAQAQRPRIRLAARFEAGTAAQAGARYDYGILCGRTRYDPRAIHALRRLVPRPQTPVRRPRLRRPGRIHCALVGRTYGCTTPASKPVRTGADGRISGYQRPAIQAVGVDSYTGPFLCGG